MIQETTLEGKSYKIMLMNRALNRDIFGIVAVTSDVRIVNVFVFHAI